MSYLENLPVTILHSICLHISDCRAFALTCRSCVDPARSILFANISITFYDTRELGQQASTWAERLRLAKSLQHVRTLQILDEDTHKPIEKSVECGDRLNKIWQYLPSDHPDRIVDEGAGWQTLADFISLLPGLRDFIYAGAPQLCPSILECIENNAPHCRIHLETFCLRSLLRFPYEQLEIHPYDRKLATHRQLYSVKLARFDEYDDSGLFDYHLDVLFDLIRGASPGLRKVSMLREKPGSSMQLISSRRQPRQKWKGSELVVFPSNSKGKLRSLELAGPDSATLEALQRWSEVTAFENLEELKLHQYIDAETATWLLNSCSLERVSRLTVHPASIAIPALFQKVGSLNELKLVSNFDNVQLVDILTRHGQTLQELAIIHPLSDSMNAADMAEIVARFCPRLQKFCMRIPRTQGNAAEVRIYQSIGQIARLRDLYLILDCRDANTSNNDNEANQLNESMRHTLINHAIDASLAKAIFETVASSNTTAHSRLRRLEIRSQSNQSYGGLGRACAVLAGQWLCEKDERDDRPGQIRVTRTKALRGTDEKLTPLVASVFDELWPDEGNKLHWSERWRSYPLIEAC
ncbi:hypothetical protein CKM354_000331100 [Cercospora kikuchii]|uniref:Uncharacterized protein n=1 Tax=Cercospora kikuchii TaxID=84275 RepID=A0A9P3CGD8_9PEZI|nr:uncharacterized protein CKM354_000331100 [Cercospora kikuchii]GIZ39950.1 hypothetical protein CKM354_000331100 [Cercospora kikuchii]